MTRRLLSGLRQARGGSAAVEFALVATPFLLMIFGIIEFGRLSWTQEALQEAAITGARCMGILGSSCAPGGTYSSSSTKSYVEQIASNWGIAITDSNVSLNESTSCGGVSGFSQVSISYTFQTVVPLVIPALSSGVPLTAQACFPNQ